MMFHNTEKREKCHRNVPQVLFVARTTIAKYSSWQKLALFLLHKLVL